MDIEDALTFASTDQLIKALQDRAIFFALYACANDNYHKYERFAWSPELSPGAVLQLLGIAKHEVSELRTMQLSGGQRILNPWEHPGFFGTQPYEWRPDEMPPNTEA